MKRPVIYFRITAMLTFICCMSVGAFCQLTNVKHGSYDTIEKDKQLINLLNRLPSYDSIKVEYPTLSQLEDRISKKSLEYTLYLPKDSFDLHPLVIFMNGGGLLVSEKDDKTMQVLGEKLSDASIAFMAIEYRTEILTLLSVNQAGYLAIQDFHEAIEHAKSIASEIKVSTDHIYIGGIGCGAVSAIHTAALEEDELEYAQFVFYDEKFGCLKCGEKSKHNSEVRGVINISGGVVDLEILKDEDFKLLQFYGDKDEIISCTYGKPYQQLINKATGLFGDWIKLDLRKEIANRLYEFMDVPELYGALSIETNKAAYPQMSIKTFPFPGYGHQLLVSGSKDKAMMTTNTIIEETISFVRSDLKANVETMVIPSESEATKEITLKGPEAKKYRWYEDGEIIYEGSEREIQYRFKEEGDKEIGLSVQNEFGVWSDVKRKWIRVVPKVSMVGRLKIDSRNPWTLFGLILILGIFTFMIYKSQN